MSSMSSQTVSHYSTPATSVAPSPHQQLDMHYYLGAGLGTLGARVYIDNRTFAGAIKSQQNNGLKPEEGGQYVVFSHVNEEQLTKIDRLRDTRYRRLRFMYLNHQEVLIVKIMAGVVHELATSEFTRILWEKVGAMDLADELGDVRGTRYHGMGSFKEADSGFKPLVRPLEADWPTLVIETGCSVNLERLRVDARWWLEHSSGGVKIVLIFSVSEMDHAIHIEHWEMVASPNLQIPQTNPQSLMIATKTAEVNIGQPVAAGSSLTISFTKIFLRQPLPGEGDIIFTTVDLERFSGNIWRRAQ